MASEEQTTVGSLFSSISGGTSYGQRLTITNRIVSKLSFYLSKTGSPTGTVTFLIRKVSDDSIIMTKLWGNAADISTTPAWYEVTFDTPTAINEEVRILATTSAGSAGNLIQVYRTDTDVKASEYRSTRTAAGVYTDDADGKDAPYKYEYSIGADAPTVTTEPATAITSTTATGHGSIVSIGTSSVTEHGHCWATTVDPTTADSKTTNGAGVAGAFTSSISDLIFMQRYYVRAYATNTTGTSYGDNVSFVAGDPSSMKSKGNIAIKGTTLRYVGYNGKEYYIQGTAV